MYMITDQLDILIYIRSHIKPLRHNTSYAQALSMIRIFFLSATHLYHNAVNKS